MSIPSCCSSCSIISGSLFASVLRKRVARSSSIEISTTAASGSTPRSAARSAIERSSRLGVPGALGDRHRVPSRTEDPPVLQLVLRAPTPLRVAVRREPLVGRSVHERSERGHRVERERVGHRHLERQRPARDLRPHVDPGRRARGAFISAMSAANGEPLIVSSAVQVNGRPMRRCIVVDLGMRHALAWREGADAAPELAASDGRAPPSRRCRRGVTAPAGRRRRCASAPSWTRSRLHRPRRPRRTTLAHPRELVVRGLLALVPVVAHHEEPQRGVPDVRRVVQDVAVPLHRVEVLGEGLEVPGDAGLQRGQAHVLDVLERSPDELAVLGPARRDREPAVAGDDRSSRRATTTA